MLSFTVVLNGKWKFVRHVEQLRRPFAIVRAQFNLCKLSVHTSPSLLPSTHACLLASEMAL